MFMPQPGPARGSPALPFGGRPGQLRQDQVQGSPLLHLSSALLVLWDVLAVGVDHGEAVHVANC